MRIRKASGSGDRFSASTPGVAARGHLLLKRFKDSEVRGVKSRKATPYDARVERDKTGRASCVKCGKGIAKGFLRFTLMLQCHKGWKNASHCHYDCFFLHPESLKLSLPSEIDGLADLDADDQNKVEADFAAMARGAGAEKVLDGGEPRPAVGTDAAGKRGAKAEEGGGVRKRPRKVDK
uniref:PARP-type domain-containing protein n=1 Tax=Hemiselmis tepida TaxID=464990 RepID=A0A7S0YZP6_9CRYP|mmetsp:Transcript_3989/g.10169  ORF Transcript_3989/g.10169 Transcript_3989/m.10169 type:complete len:179 (+) Transcript_3989:46-582(+)